MARPTRIARLVVDRVGGSLSVDVFTEPELYIHYGDKALTVRVINAITDFGHFEEADEEYLLLFFDALELKGLPQ